MLTAKETLNAAYPRIGRQHSRRPKAKSKATRIWLNLVWVINVIGKVLCTKVFSNVSQAIGDFVHPFKTQCFYSKWPLRYGKISWHLSADMGLPH